MSRKSVAIVLLVVGIVVLLVSASADIVGLGSDPNVFGYRQLAGSVAGAILALVGALLYWRAGRQA